MRLSSLYGDSHHRIRPSAIAKCHIHRAIYTFQKTKRSTCPSLYSQTFRRYREKSHIQVSSQSIALAKSSNLKPDCSTLASGRRSPASNTAESISSGSVIAARRSICLLSDLEVFIDLRTAAANARSAGRPLALGPEGTEVKPLVAHALSRELQLYFDRLTSAAVVSI